MKSSSYRGTAGWETTAGIVSTLLPNRKDFFRAGAGGTDPSPGLVSVSGGKSGCTRRGHVQRLRERPGEGLPHGGDQAGIQTHLGKGMNDQRSCGQAKWTGKEKQKAEL